MVHGWIKEEPEMVQEVGPGIGPEECLEKDYEDDGSDEETEEVEGVGGSP